MATRRKSAASGPARTGASSAAVGAPAAALRSSMLYLFRHRYGQMVKFFLFRSLHMKGRRWVAWEVLRPAQEPSSQGRVPLAGVGSAGRTTTLRTIHYGQQDQI